MLSKGKTKADTAWHRHPGTGILAGVARTKLNMRSNCLRGPGLKFEFIIFLLLVWLPTMATVPRVGFRDFLHLNQLPARLYNPVCPARSCIISQLRNSPKKSLFLLALEYLHFFVNKIDLAWLCFLIIFPCRKESEKLVCFLGTQEREVFLYSEKLKRKKFLVSEKLM